MGQRICTEPIDVRYAGPNGLSANASPLLSLIRNGHFFGPSIAWCEADLPLDMDQIEEVSGVKLAKIRCVLFARIMSDQPYR